MIISLFVVYDNYLCYTLIISVLQECFNPFPNKSLFYTCLQYKSFENTVGKRKIARNEQFLLFPHCFLPFWMTFCQFHQIQIDVCKVFEFGRF